MAEEIVRIIKVDTKNSGKSIKDLRDEIKSLRTELEKTEVGSKEFESTLKQLTQTQKSYNEVQQQIRDLSRTNQQDMVKFASFAKNLGKSYSALNAAIGLFADKNEDVQKAMLKVQRTIQLIQGLDGITGLIRDIPGVVKGFKDWWKALDPVERQVDRIAKGINGIDPAKARAMNEAGRAGQGGAATASAGGNTVNQTQQQNQAIQQQTRLITALNAVRQEEINRLKDLQGKLDVQTAKYQSASKAALGLQQALNQNGITIESLTAKIQSNEKMIKSLSLTARLGNKQSQERIVLLKQENIELVKQREELKVIDAASKMYATDAMNAAKAQNVLTTQIETSQAKLKGYEAALAGAATGVKQLGTALKTIGKTVGWTLVISAAITLVLKLLDSMGLTVDAFWDWVTGANSATKAQRAFNKEVNEGTNQGAAKAVVVLKELSIAYSKLGDSAEKKKEFLEKYSDKIKETGLSIDDLKKAEDVFVNNTDKYVNAIMARAKAQAVENAAVKIYEDYLNERYDLEQKFEKDKNKAAGTNSKEEYITLLKGMGMTAAQAEEAWNTATNKRQQKILDQIDAADKKVQDRLKQMFETVAELEQEYAGMFTSVTSKSGGASTDWAKEYKEALDALRGYVDDYLDIFKDARTKELDDNRKTYEENVKNINLNFLKGVAAAQGNAKKLLEIENKKNTALKMAQLAYERRRLEIIDKYNEEEYKKYRDQLDKEYELLEKQLERTRRLQDTSNLKEPAKASYQSTKTTKFLGWGGVGTWTSAVQSKEQAKKEMEDQKAYNDQFYAATKERLTKENELLGKENDILVKKAKSLKEQLEKTDIFDVEKRKELAEQLNDVEYSIFTNERTIVENKMAIRKADTENAEANMKAQTEYEEKMMEKLQARLQIASQVAGAMAQIARTEAQNAEEGSKKQKAAMAAYKTFAVAQAIADTWRGANEAFVSMASIPYIGPGLGMAAAAAAVAMGLANVHSILSEKMTSSSQTASVSAPAPMETAPIEYTRNLVGDKELDEINQPIRCYVLESDISKTQNKVKVTEMNATF